MKRLAVALIAGALAAAPLPCAAEAGCAPAAVQARVEAGPGELTLADLLTHDVCGQLRQAAAQVSLGVAPRAGSVRVLDGREVRGLFEEILGGGRKQTAAMQIPERIVVERAGATKSCAEIAGFLASASSSHAMAGVPGRWRENLDCAGARAIPEEARLELSRSAWNPALRRWEFAMRCVQAKDCVPFLVWARAGNAAGGIAAPRLDAARSPFASAGSAALSPAQGSGGERLVKPGQTATLSWEQGGIRIVLPVTCLEGGGLGQLVRVRFKNAPRILRAEVLSDGTLRASL